MNEPAFPNEGFNGWGKPFEGMTLRDYFAAKAVAGIVQCTGYATNKACKDTAECSYEVADAMLAAREKS